MAQIMEFTVLPIFFGGLFLAVLVSMQRVPAKVGTGQVFGRDDLGRASYRVIGYTEDGTAITRPIQSQTDVNYLAVLTLMLGVMVPPVAVVVGHTARAQIRATGERGDTIARIGLALGYVSWFFIAAGLVLVLAAMSF